MCGSRDRVVYRSKTVLVCNYIELINKKSEEIHVVIKRNLCSGLVLYQVLEYVIPNSRIRYMHLSHLLISLEAQ